jgi:hypothetical protein
MTERRHANAGPYSDGWPEITYGYVMHYYWEPQHLLHTARSLEDAIAHGKDPWTVVDRAMRRQEVPLNYLFNLLLRLGPASMRSACLDLFGVGPDPAFASLSLRPPGEFVLPPEDSEMAQRATIVQPDVHLESDSARVFIELKLDAKLTVTQIDKYIRLHEGLDRTQGQAKRRWILLLVKKDPVWLYDGEARDAVKVPDLAARLSSTSNLTPGDVTYGATTWDHLASGLDEYLRDRSGDSSEAMEMLKTLIEDFRDDLRRRPGLLEAEAKS